MKELSRAQVEKILKRDPEIVAVHWPREWQFGKVNLALWSQDEEERERHIHLLEEEYLRRPCIEDTFGGDYLARKKWKGKYREGEWGIWWLYLRDQDALRYGTMRTIPHFCGGLLDNYVGSDAELIQPEVAKLKLIVPKIFQEYDANSTTRKIELVGELKDTLYGLLQYFYESVPQVMQ